jgi:hypothetical protein
LLCSSSDVAFLRDAVCFLTPLAKDYYFLTVISFFPLPSVAVAARWPARSNARPPLQTTSKNSIELKPFKY